MPPILDAVISATEAAARLKITRQHVTRLCREGTLTGRLRGKVWYVCARSVKQFKPRSYTKGTR